MYRPAGHHILEPVDVLHIRVVLRIAPLLVLPLLVLLIIVLVSAKHVLRIIVLVLGLLVLLYTVVLSYAVLEDVGVSLGTLVGRADPLAAGANTANNATNYELLF